MELLGDVGHIESCFGPFGGSVSVGARLMHYLHQMYHRLKIHFGRTRWYSKIIRLKWKFNLVHLEIVLILTQDRSMICNEHITGSNILLDAPDGTRG
jgi:hypothetical protein